MHCRFTHNCPQTLHSAWITRAGRSNSPNTLASTRSSCNSLIPYSHASQHAHSPSTAAHRRTTSTSHSSTKRHHGSVAPVRNTRGSRVVWASTRAAAGITEIAAGRLLRADAPLYVRRRALLAPAAGRVVCLAPGAASSASRNAGTQPKTPCPACRRFANTASHTAAQEPSSGLPLQRTSSGRRSEIVPDFFRRPRTSPHRHRSRAVLGDVLAASRPGAPRARIADHLVLRSRASRVTRSGCRRSSPWPSRPGR